MADDETEIDDAAAAASESAEATAVTEDAPEAAVAQPDVEVESEPAGGAEAAAETAEPVADGTVAAEGPDEGDARGEAAEDPPAASGAESPAPAEAASPAAAEAATPRAKRKRLPRALRHKHAKTARQRSESRAPLVRAPKPEREIGRRQERRGVVVSDKGDKSIVVKVETIQAHPRYKKVVRRSRRLHAHDERNDATVGDVVRIVESRPLSRTKHWRLVEILQKAR
jgi:small subunit ribosomal protein S17